MRMRNDLHVWVYWRSCLFCGLCFLFSHARIGLLIEPGRETEKLITLCPYVLLVKKSFRSGFPWKKIRVPHGLSLSFPQKFSWQWASASASFISNPIPARQNLFRESQRGGGGGGGRGVGVGPSGVGAGQLGPLKNFLFELTESSYLGHYLTIVSTRPSMNLKEKSFSQSSTGDTQTQRGEVIAKRNLKRAMIFQGAQALWKWTRIMSSCFGEVSNRQRGMDISGIL